MRSITPPNTNITFIFLYINKLHGFLPKYIFSANVQKKQQFVRSLGNAQRLPEVKSALPLGPGVLIVFFNQLKKRRFYFTTNFLPCWI